MSQRGMRFEYFAFPEEPTVMASTSIHVSGETEMPKIIEHVLAPKGSPAECAYCRENTRIFCESCQTYVCEKCHDEHDRRLGLGLKS